MDSYSETNQDDQLQIGTGSAQTGMGQSFTAIGAKLGSVKFYLVKNGSPTGNANAKIYAHSGTFGTSSVPTGTALATSDNLDVSTLNPAFSWQLITLPFSGANQVTLVNGTNYVISIEYTGGSAGNSVEPGYDSSSATHGGNAATLSGTWTAHSTWDMCFYVYST